MITALLLLAVAVLVLLNGFFVAAEFAYVRARKAHLETEAAAGKRGAALAVAISGDLSRYLSACQLGITLTSLGIGFLGEPAIAFVNRVADAAEDANHHPDIFVHGWNKVRLTLSTHSEGGLTDADHALARRIDGVIGG